MGFYDEGLKYNKSTSIFLAASLAPEKQNWIFNNSPGLQAQIHILDINKHDLFVYLFVFFFYPCSPVRLTYSNSPTQLLLKAKSHKKILKPKIAPLLLKDIPASNATRNSAIFVCLERSDGFLPLGQSLGTCAFKVSTGQQSINIEKVWGHFLLLSPTHLQPAAA